MAEVHFFGYAPIQLQTMFHDAFDVDFVYCPCLPMRVALLIFGRNGFCVDLLHIKS